MKKDENNQDERQEAYPRPTEADKQFNDQPEYINQQPNRFEDQSVSSSPQTKKENKDDKS